MVPEEMVSNVEIEAFTGSRVKERLKQISGVYKFRHIPLNTVRTLVYHTVPYSNCNFGGIIFRHAQVSYQIGEILVSPRLNIISYDLIPLYYIPSYPQYNVYTYIYIYTVYTCKNKVIAICMYISIIHVYLFIYILYTTIDHYIYIHTHSYSYTLFKKHM